MNPEDYNTKMKTITPRVFTIGQTLNERQVLLKPFCDRMPSIKASTVCSLMSHIPTGDLDALYKKFDTEARNFTALWKWHFMPKRAKSEQSADRQIG